MASVFTRIAQGSLPAHKLFEDETAMVILDAFPIRKGHTLVIPKKEEADLFDLDEPTYNALWKLAHRTAKALRRCVDCERVAVVVLGFEVPHAHIHLIPIDAESELDFSKKQPLVPALAATLEADIKAVF